MKVIGRIYSRTFSLFASMPFAVALLCLLAIASVAGTVIAQNRGTDFYRSTLGDFWHQWFSRLGLLDLYHTWWYQGLLLFLLLSLAAALWRHAPWIWSQFRTPKDIPTPPQPQYQELTFRNRDIDQLKEILTSLGFKRWQHQTVDGLATGFSRRGRAGRISFFPIHAGLIVILIGGLVSTQFGYRGVMNLSEGETSNQVHVRKGDSFETLQLPFHVRNENFSMSHYSNGMPSSYQTRLTLIEEGKPHHSQTIAVNEPLQVGDTTLYQASFGDAGSPVSMLMTDLTNAAFPQQMINSEVHKTLENASGNLIRISELRDHNVMNLSDNPQHARLRDVGPSLDVQLQPPGSSTLTYRSYLHYPHILSFQRLGEDKMTTVELGFAPSDQTKMTLLATYLEQLYKDSQALETTERRKQAFAAALDALGIPRSEARELGPMVARTHDVLKQHSLPALFTFTKFDLQRYTGLQVTKDPGAPLIWLGSLLLLVGLCLMCITEYRIWVIQEDTPGLSSKLILSSSRANKWSLHRLRCEIEQQFSFSANHDQQMQPI